MQRWLFEAKCGRLVKRVGEEKLVSRCSSNGLAIPLLLPVQPFGLRDIANGRYWKIRQAMKLQGIKSSSIPDIVAALLTKGVPLLDGSSGDDVRPPTSRFQSALAQRIAAANVMWGASDVVDFKVRAGRGSGCAPVHVKLSSVCSLAAIWLVWRCDGSARTAALVSQRAAAAAADVAGLRTALGLDL
jgi:hypothetical protein